MRHRRRRRNQPDPRPDTPAGPMVIEVSDQDLRGRRVQSAPELQLAHDGRGLLPLSGDTLLLIEPRHIDLQPQPGVHYMDRAAWHRLRRYRLRKAQP